MLDPTVMLLRRLAYYLRSIPTLLAGMEPTLPLLALFLGLPGASPLTLRLRPSGLRLRVRGAMDAWIAKETCLDRDYERVGVPVGAGWRVVDIGAALGDWALDSALRQPTSEVHAYEPSPDSFRLLEENIRLNGLPNVRAFPEAIHAGAERVTMDISGAGVQHRTTRGAGVEVPATTLDVVLQRLGAPCDLLKMDCEGAEYQILFGASPDSLRQVRRIVMEYHDGVGEHSHPELVRFLEAQGFAVAATPNPVQPDLGFLFATRRG